MVGGVKAVILLLVVVLGQPVLAADKKPQPKPAMVFTNTDHAARPDRTTRYLMEDFRPLPESADITLA
jgi:hypothetical protein